MIERLNIGNRVKLLLAIPVFICATILLGIGRKRRAVTLANWIGRFDWPLQFSSSIFALCAHRDADKEPNWEFGYKYMKSQCEKRPDARYLWQWLAEIQQGMGFLEEAQDSLRHMALLNGSRTPFEKEYERGKSASEAGRYDEAIQHFREAIKHRPDLPETHVALGAVYYKQGNQRASVREYAAAVRLDSSFTHYIPNDIRHSVLTRSKFQE